MFVLSNYRDNIAIILDSGIEVKYSELHKVSASFGNVVAKRSLVICLCENKIGSLIGYISFIDNGLVPIMIEGTKDSDFFENLLSLYKPNYIWYSKRKHDARFGSIVFEYADYCLVEYSQTKIALDDDLALLLTTSGSTGSPKLVRLSYDNIRSNAESIAEYLNITEQERPITSLPMYYSYGLSVINSHLIKGATILLTDRSVLQKEFWEFAKEQKATSIAGVPYTYEMLRRLRVMKMDLPHLKTFTQAGGKLNPKFIGEYVAQAKEAGKEFIVMYGQTEATARMSYLPFERAEQKCSSIGIAIPGGEFHLIDTDGNRIVGADIDGELVYCGANVSMGYAESLDDLALGNENNGILKTGDVARRDSDGFYYITGRLKRFVKIYGNRVNLDATEQLVKEITTSCACVGVDDKLTIFTTVEGKEKEIRDLLSKKTGLNNRAFSVVVIDALPKNTSGKIQYAELLNLL